MNRHELALKKLHEGTVIPANPLALDENRKFDEKRQRAVCRYYLDSGVGGLAVAVHTTQFEIRDPEYNLLEPVLRVAKDEAAKYEEATGKVIVMVAGACGPKEQAVKEALLAKSLGYDAVLLSPGGLNHLSEEELIERTRAVAEVMPVIGFYLQTAVGGRHFTYDYWTKIAEIPGVVAIKAAPFNRYYTYDVVRAVAMSSRRDEITLYTGNDDNIVLDLITTYRFEIDGKTYEKGFIGGLLGHWSVWTKKAVELFEKCKAVRGMSEIPAEILTLAAEVTDTNAVFFDTANDFKGCIAGLHEVLRRQGIFKGTWCLNPDEKMSQGQAEEIDRIYKAYPHLNDDEFIKANLDRWLAD
ncbi:MAG: dihydrodipicolinate synthase family protein [Clostridia bacterium]|nr:dihydrodipicolinate synthase family protein [Clostridia bacterium]